MSTPRIGVLRSVSAAATSRFRKARETGIRAETREPARSANGILERSTKDPDFTKGPTFWSDLHSATYRHGALGFGRRQIVKNGKFDG